MVHSGKDGYKDLEKIRDSTLGMVRVLPEIILFVVPEFQTPWGRLNDQQTFDSHLLIWDGTDSRYLLAHYFGHLRDPYFPMRNPRIPTAVNEQKYFNDSINSCDALITQSQGWGVAGLDQRISNFQSQRRHKGCIRAILKVLIGRSIRSGLILGNK